MIGTTSTVAHDEESCAHMRRIDLRVSTDIPSANTRARAERGHACAAHMQIHRRYTDARADANTNKPRIAPMRGVHCLRRVCVRAYHRDLQLGTIGGGSQRQQRAVVLQQHQALLRARLPSDTAREACRSDDRPRCLRCSGAARGGVCCGAHRIASPAQPSVRACERLPSRHLLARPAAQHPAACMEHANTPPHARSSGRCERRVAPPPTWLT